MDSWIKQFDHADAGIRAQHQPARDLLIAAGVISPPGRPKKGKTEVIVQVYKPTAPVVIEAEESDEPAQLPARITPELPDEEPTS